MYNTFSYKENYNIPVSFFNLTVSIILLYITLRDLTILSACRNPFNLRNIFCI